MFGDGLFSVNEHFAIGHQWTDITLPWHIKEVFGELCCLLNQH